MERCEFFHHGALAFSVCCCSSVASLVNQPRLFSPVVIYIALLQQNKICLEKQGQSITWSIHVDISEVLRVQRKLISTVHFQMTVHRGF